MPLPVILKISYENLYDHTRTLVLDLRRKRRVTEGSDQKPVLDGIARTKTF